jgi:hypothetical protein
MNNNSFVTETLLKKRDQLVAENRKMNEQFEAELSEIEGAIETLTGKKVWEVSNLTTYDDENPIYIKSSEEEI